NSGTGPTSVSAWTDAVVASPDAVAGNRDDIVLARFDHTGALAVAAGYTRSESFLLPPAFQGRFHLFVRSDIPNVVFEHASQSNNAAEAGNLFDVTPTPYADLVVNTVTAPA